MGCMLSRATPQLRQRRSSTAAPSGRRSFSACCPQIRLNFASPHSVMNLLAPACFNSPCDGLEVFLSGCNASLLLQATAPTFPASLTPGWCAPPSGGRFCQSGRSISNYTSTSSLLSSSCCCFAAAPWSLSESNRSTMGLTWSCFISSWLTPATCSSFEQWPVSNFFFPQKK